MVQNEAKYGELFADTDLFIIFGCLFGGDRQLVVEGVARALVEQSDSELMVYRCRSPHESGLTDKDIRDRFAAVAGSDEASRTSGRR